MGNVVLSMLMLMLSGDGNDLGKVKALPGYAEPDYYGIDSQILALLFVYNFKIKCVGV